MDSPPFCGKYARYIRRGILQQDDYTSLLHSVIPGLIDLSFIKTSSDPHPYHGFGFSYWALKCEIATCIYLFPISKIKRGKGLLNQWLMFDHSQSSSRKHTIFHAGAFAWIHQFAIESWSHLFLIFNIKTGVCHKMYVLFCAKF